MTSTVILAGRMNDWLLGQAFDTTAASSAASYLAGLDDGSLRDAAVHGSAGNLRLSLYFECGARWVAERAQLALYCKGLIDEKPETTGARP